MKLRVTDFKQLLLKSMNPIIKILIFSDTLMVGAAGMLGPVFAIFVEDFIEGSTALVVGLSTSIYLISRCLLQVPVATMIDRIKGERDDYFLLSIFTFIFGLLYLALLFINKPYQLYIVQALMGLATAITYPSYYAIFTRHIDKFHEGTEWGVYYTFVDLSSAALATIGGYIAGEFGFEKLIIIVSVISMLGSLSLIPLRKFLRIKPIKTIIPNLNL